MNVDMFGGHEAVTNRSRAQMLKNIPIATNTQSGPTAHAEQQKIN